MDDLETLLQPVFDDSPEPARFVNVRTRATRVRRRRSLRALIATVVLVGTLGAGTVAVARRSHRDRMTVVTPSAPTTRFHVGTPAPVSKYGIDMISAFGSIWVSLPDHVARFDAATGRMLATIAVPGTSDSRNLAAGAGSIWVDDTGTQKVTRIDATRNTVVATIRLPDAALVVDGLAFVDGKLWIVRPAPNDDSRGGVVSVDPATNRVALRANIPRTFDVMAGGNHALWYVRGTDLLRFNTETTDVTIVRHDVTSVLAAANLHLWLLTSAGVIETDELNGTEFGPAIPVANRVNVTVAEGADAVWIAGQPDSSTAGTVTPYDLVTHRPLAPPTPVGLPIAKMSALDAALWVDAGGVMRIPYSREAASVPGPTAANDDILIFDDGYDGVLAVDPTARVAVRRVVSGQRAGDQPFRSLLTDDTLVVGWDDVYAAPLSTGRSRFIGKGIVIPAEVPGRVWLMPFESSPASYRLVDLAGHVFLETKGLTSTQEPVAITDGLAFARDHGIELWNARRNAVTGTLGTATSRPGASFGTTLAWSRDGRSDLQLTATDTRATRAVALPDGVTGVDASVARFSNDGTLLAVEATAKGAAEGEYSVIVVDVATARVVRTIAPMGRFPAFAWSTDGARLYLASYGYQQPTMTLRRVDIASGAATDTALPFGGGIASQLVPRSGAGVLLEGPETTPSDCPAPSIQPSGRTQTCRFHY